MKIIEDQECPYIFRVKNGENLQYVSTRIVEYQFLSKYFNYLKVDVYTYAKVKSIYISESEATLLNTINIENNQKYGNELFRAGTDYIVRVEDFLEFFTYIKICYTMLQSNTIPIQNDKCGFICINHEFLVPYCVINKQKYLPLFYFEIEPELHLEYLKNRAVKIDNWNLAYLKFCFKVQGINNEFFDSNSCFVSSLDDIKYCFPQETQETFKDVWPTEKSNILYLKNLKYARVKPPGAWISAPSRVMNQLPTQSHTSYPFPPVGPPPSIRLSKNIVVCIKYLIYCFLNVVLLFCVF